MAPRGSARSSENFARVCPRGGEALMVGARPRPWEPQRIWPTGEYTLLADSHTAENGLTYSQGETLALSEKEATRLGTAGAIAPPDSMHAVRARTESGRGTMRDGYLYQMWTLTGDLQDRGGL